MKYIIKQGMVYLNGHFQRMDLGIDSQGKLHFQALPAADTEFIEGSHLHVLPGFIDVHVHLREPGFSHKETIKQGTMAAARGGFTTVLAMPNLNPVPDNLAHLAQQLELIARDACINVLPYGAITVGERGLELADLPALAPYCAAFSDDGKGVQQDSLMRKAMQIAKTNNKLIAAHCEDESELHGGCIHEGIYAQDHNYPGINSASEWKQVERDLQLAMETGCQYHICHVSTKESVALLRQAKQQGIRVSAEVTVHHLLLCDQNIPGDDGRYKMNPPLRDSSDQEALLAGLLDGTIDMIATDHAPHTAKEKQQGLRGSAMGIVGLETAFPLLYSHLVKPGLLTLEELVARMSTIPANIFGLEGGQLQDNTLANLVLVDLNRQEQIDSNTFLSMGRSTPFDGWQVTGTIELTIAKGSIAYRRAI